MRWRNKEGHESQKMKNKIIDKGKGKEKEIKKEKEKEEIHDDKEA